MSGLNGFDRIANVYDALAFLVFGLTIRKAQCALLNHLPKDGAILIIGGGSGWIANEVAKRSGAKITYVEASSKMISLARTTTRLNPQIEFMHGTTAEIPSGLKFDAVITNFYLDLFNDKTLARETMKINSCLTNRPLWFVTDFIDEGKWWQRLLLFTMYKFFRITTDIEATHLPEWEQSMSSIGRKKREWRSFYSGFIKTAVFY
jgi:tRNA (cmo5U34)-methyltransferase